ncbi:Uncharacterised protein [Raoultella ornithinolytica]|nr:Uncharacterised protein [Raoultella ornithinolytica]
MNGLMRLNFNGMAGIPEAYTLDIIIRQTINSRGIFRYIADGI